jgi:predicted small metal-binding protein
VKKFSCGDVIPDCTASFTAEANDEILAQVAVHARDDHGIEEVTPDIVEQVTAAIVNVPA